MLGAPARVRSDEYKSALLSGHRGAIYPILFYILSKFPVLAKRAYVARFLMPVEVPAEFGGDPVIQDVLQQYAELQEEFKEAHKNVERLVRGSCVRRRSVRRVKARATRATIAARSHSSRRSGRSCWSASRR